jgi:shikimate kinase
LFDFFINKLVVVDQWFYKEKKVPFFMDPGFTLDRSYVFIGVSSAGKSLYGKLTADTFGVPFDDVDIRFDEILRFNSDEGNKHQITCREDLLRSQGHDFYLSFENELLDMTHINEKPSIIAPPGSIVYHRFLTGEIPSIPAHCPRSNIVNKWKKQATFVYLEITLEELRARNPDVMGRGVVSPDPRVRRCLGTPDFLPALFQERVPLFKDVQDLTVNLTRPGLGIPESENIIIEAIKRYQKQNPLLR